MFQCHVSAKVAELRLKHRSANPKTYLSSLCHPTSLDVDGHLKGLLASIMVISLGKHPPKSKDGEKSKITLSL